MPTVAPADALLVVDIGNSNVHVAVSDEDGLHAVAHAATKDPTQWSGLLERAWSTCANSPQRQAVIGSVAPEATVRLSSVVEDVCGVSPFEIRADLPLPIEVDVEEPDRVGVDRVCAAAAAFHAVNGPCAIASFGTAATIDGVDANGVFRGGVIMPGFDLALRALHEFTAQLPAVEATVPNSVFGRNTTAAIQAGVSFGLVGALREVVERFATEFNEWPHVVVTGGNAGLIHPIADFVDSVVPNLVLMGIALAYRRASGQTS